MNIKQIITVGIAGIAMGAMALDNVEVTDVKARQRYPWNGKVDIDFTLDSKPTEPYQMQVEVYDNVGKTNLVVKSVCTEGVSFESNPCMVRTDTSRIVWDAAKDLPNGFKCTNVLVSCRDDRSVVDSQRYMIIDISAGTSAGSYPISYTNCPPRGGWTEEYARQRIVLRRIEPQSFLMGSPTAETGYKTNEVLHTVTLTRPYYIGVFEITEKQYSLVTGCAESEAKPIVKTWEEIRGKDLGNTESVLWQNNTLTVAAEGISTDCCFPTSNLVDEMSFMGKLRNKTGLSFDLPTEAQWECACRAGTSMPLNIGVTNSAENASLISGPAKPIGAGWQYVGNYLPNSYGIYDMNGNVSEWCLDIYADNLGGMGGMDPIGSEVYLTDVMLVNESRWLQTGTYTPIVYNGKYYYGSSGGGYYTGRIQLIQKSIPRVVRGEGPRIAQRGFALNINTTGYMFTNGATANGETFRAEYDNPRHGIRLALTLAD